MIEGNHQDVYQSNSQDYGLTKLGKDFALAFRGAGQLKAVADGELHPLLDSSLDIVSNITGRPAFNATGNFKNLAAVAKAGGSVDRVIRTRIMLTDITRWRAAARAHGESFGDIRPACTFVQVGGFIDPEWLVEVEMDCVV